MIKEIAIIVGGFVLLIAGIWTLSSLYVGYQCRNHAEITGAKTYHRMYLGACYVELDGQMHRWDEYKAIRSANRGLEQLSNAVEGKQ